AALVDSAFCRRMAAASKTPVQTVRADFPHTAYRWSLGEAAVRGTGILDRASQAMEPETVEVVAVPALPLTRPEVTSLALHAQAAETPPHVRVELVEAPRGVAGAE